MDNPAGCPISQAQAVGCPQAPQGPTTTQTKKQQRPGVAINYHAQSTDHQRRLTNRRHQPSIYTAKRATQRSPRSVTIPEIAGHVRRNAHDVKYAWIEKHRQTYSTTLMCELLSVSCS